jgi:hypothetical protein
MLARLVAADRWCWPSRPDLGERWPSRLVATATAIRAGVRGRNPRVDSWPRHGLVKRG